MDDASVAKLLGAVRVVQPETILRWHRAGFRRYWRWKSGNRAGRPKIDRGLRELIQRMSRENTKWGASRIHGELLMLGFEVAQSTVSKYMVRPSGSPSQGWKTFFRNHAEAIAAIDLCVVPTLTFERLFAFLVLGHGRRQLLWFEVTRHGRMYFRKTVLACGEREWRHVEYEFPAEAQRAFQAQVDRMSRAFDLAFTQFCDETVGGQN